MMRCQCRIPAATNTAHSPQPLLWNQCQVQHIETSWSDRVHGSCVGFMVCDLLLRALLEKSMSHCIPMTDAKFHKQVFGTSTLCCASRPKQKLPIISSSPCRFEPILALKSPSINRGPLVEVLFKMITMYTPLHALIMFVCTRHGPMPRSHDPIHDWESHFLALPAPAPD